MKKPTILVQAAALAGLCLSLAGCGQSPQEKQAQACLSQIDSTSSWDIVSNDEVYRRVPGSRPNPDYLFKEGLIDYPDYRIAEPVQLAPAPVQADFRRAEKCVAGMTP